VAFGLGEAAPVTCATGLDDDRATGALPQPAKRKARANAAAVAPSVGLMAV